MAEPIDDENLEDGPPLTRLVKVDGGGNPIPFEWGNGYQVQDKSWGQRIICSTGGDRIAFLLRLTERSQGPFGLTYILEDNAGAPEFARGRYSVNSPLSLDQLRFILQEFHEFLGEDGRHHVMIHCLTTGLSTIFDQHDYFYAYGEIPALGEELKREGFPTLDYELGVHGHRIGQKPDELRRLMAFRPWRWSELEATDTSKDRVGRWQYLKMELRAKWFNLTRRAPK